MNVKKKMLTSSSFPEDFLWGASTAGHQVEGGNFDQWTVWEQDNAKMLADTAADRLRWLPDWLKIKDQAEDPDNYISGKGVDHYHKYKEDFKILKKIGLNSFRFGVEWSRIEPEQGVWNKAAIDYYHNYIDELKSQGIEPVLNLWHWTHPVWFDELGGFSKRANIKHFERFVEKVAEEFADQINFVITINEPNVYMFYREMNGGTIAVPPVQPIWKRLKTFFWLIRAHNQAYKIFKRYNPSVWISAAYQMAHNAPKKPTFISKSAVYFADKFGNYLFYDLTKRQLDFIGFNYYFTNYFDGVKLKNPQSPVNDLGWYMEPAGVGDVAVKVWLRYRLPILITENGVADADDQYRKWWLEETMNSLAKARQSGADVFGYMHWSLLDNFEWHQGWWPKFGLIKVDRERQMKRIVRPSAVWWSEELEKLNKN